MAIRERRCLVRGCVVDHQPVVEPLRHGAMKGVLEQPPLV
jgi:hypothetical protein